MLDLFILYVTTVLLICSFTCGLRTVTAPGKILAPLRTLFEKAPDILAKPLIKCIYCMPSLWGTLIYWGAILVVEKEVTAMHVLIYPLSVISASYYNIYFSKGLTSVE